MNRNNFRITLQGRSFEVEVLDDPYQREIRVRVNGKIWPVTVEDLARVNVPEPVCTLKATEPVSIGPAQLKSSSGEAQALQATIIKAPIPGVITEIYVQSNQAVRCGQDLCSIETMKMNNVIQAPVAGRIDQICVSPGQAVGFDQPLLEIRP